ncbi:MAG: hypothetical protein GKR87_06035 [Kiritimatiellae bacterium]|nr:hypothetical protein [Kiritimatiellia bacterium]
MRNGRNGNKADAGDDDDDFVPPHTVEPARGDVRSNQEDAWIRKVDEEKPYGEVFTELRQVGKAKGRSRGVSFGFYTNEELFLWAETLARLKIDKDLNDFKPTLEKRGEQSRVLFSEDHAYGLKLIYKEHRGQPKGSSFRSFEQAHRYLGALTPSMMIGNFYDHQSGFASGAAIERMTRTATNHYIKERGKKFVRELLDFFIAVWRRGIFDGDLVGLGDNRPGLKRDKGLLILDFGLVADATQDMLYKPHTVLGDDPFHMAIDKLHVIRNKLRRVSSYLSRYFESKLEREFGLHLFPREAWEKGRRGSRGSQQAVPLAEQLRRVVKACSPLQPPVDHYVTPWVDPFVQHFVAGYALRRRTREVQPLVKRWVEEEEMQKRTLQEIFPPYSELIDQLASQDEIGIKVLWHGYRVSDFEEALSLLSDPLFASRFFQILVDHKKEHRIHASALRQAFMSDFNQTVIALLALSGNTWYKKTTAYMAQASLVGREALNQAFQTAPIRFFQTLERITGLWGSDISAARRSSSRGSFSFKQAWAFLLKFDPEQGRQVLRKSFERDSLQLTRILMEVQPGHNVERTFKSLTKTLGRAALIKLYRQDFFEFFNVLNMPEEIRCDFDDRWAFLCKEVCHARQLRKAFTEEPRLFMGIVPFLSRAWCKIIKESSLNDKGEIDVNQFLEAFRIKLVFVSSNVAGLNSTNGLIQAWNLNSSHYEIGVRNQMRESVDLVRRRFPYQTITDDIEPVRSRIVIRYLNTADVPLRRFPHAPFKLILPSKMKVRERNRFRSRMELGMRKLVVVSCPLPKETEALINAIKQMPSRKRPVVVLGMREADYQLKEAMCKRGFSAVARDFRDESLAGFGERNFVVLNTKGELIDFLGAADLSIVGMDRNIFEPASQEVPILYFQGLWHNNQIQRDRLTATGAAIPIEPSRMHRQMIDLLDNPDVAIKGIRKAIRAFKTDTLPAARFISSLAVTDMIVKNHSE